MPVPDERGVVAALVSGGVDSGVLCVELLRRFGRVRPIYVRFGLRWEADELASLRAFLGGASRPGLTPLTVLDEPVRDVYGEHWSTGGPAVPLADSPDDAVYLPGRNLLLAAKAAVWCRLRDVHDLALGTLASNPFPDSTPEFYRGLEAVLALGLAGPVRLLRPFEGLSKADVLRLGLEAGLPIGSTFSCLDPIGGRHCGRCNKCGERRRGFRDVGHRDTTDYAHPEADPAGRRPRPLERPRVPCIE